MIMKRWFAAALSLALLGATPAGAHLSAQSVGAPASTEAAITATHIDRARDALRAMLIDSEVLSQASSQTFTALIPVYREQFESALFFGALATSQRRAVLAYIDNAAPIVQEETARAAPELIDRFAPRLATIFTEAELTDIAAFMRTPLGAHMFRHSVFEAAQHNASGDHTDHDDFTPEELEAIQVFENTPGGIALNAHIRELAPLMREIGTAALNAPTVGARIQRDICAIAGTRCPRAWRDGV
jgi:hypothetical protein